MKISEGRTARGATPGAEVRLKPSNAGGPTAAFGGYMVKTAAAFRTRIKSLGSFVLFVRYRPSFSWRAACILAYGRSATRSSRDTAAQLRCDFSHFCFDGTLLHFPK